MRRRSVKDGQDFVLVVLLALDKTGHSLAPGSVAGIEAIAGRKAMSTLDKAGLVQWDSTDGTLELTQRGRDEARIVAADLAGPQGGDHG